MNPADLFAKTPTHCNSRPEMSFSGKATSVNGVLLEGEMDVRLGDYVVETAKEGALIGEMALIDDSPRAANAVAKPPVDWRQSINGGSIFSFNSTRISRRT